jgi:hypothetical protein
MHINNFKYFYLSKLRLIDSDEDVESSESDLFL